MAASYSNPLPGFPDPPGWLLRLQLRLLHEIHQIIVISDPLENANHSSH
jgi:hypothetical protein